MWIQKLYLPVGNHSAVGAGSKTAGHPSNSIPLGHDMAWQILAKWSESSAPLVSLHDPKLHQMPKRVPQQERWWPFTTSKWNTTALTSAYTLAAQCLVSAIQLALNNFRLWNHLRRSQHKMPSTTSEIHQTRPEHGIHIYLFIYGLCIYLSILCIYLFIYV